jgi:DNA invertase Pin-like site-specific DNA recombinase
MIAAYLRVSSRAQDLATQRHAIERACRARKVKITKWFADELTSRAVVRPGLTAIKHLARTGEISDLYVYKLDRLSRGTISEVLNLMNELEGSGCVVHSVADEFPLQGPFREPVVAMLAMCAHMEREAIAGRIAAARARIEAAGGKWGRPRKVTEKQEQKIHRLRSQNVPVRKIAQMLRLSAGTISHYLPKRPRPAKAPAKPARPRGRPRLVTP